MKTSCAQTVASIAVTLLSQPSAIAADAFPSKPIRIIVASAPGGSLDTTTRLVAKHMGDQLGQQVIVENRAGAGSLIAIRSVKTSPPDGYTLLAGVNTIALQQSMSQDPGYDLAKDFVGVAPMTRAPFLLVKGSGQPDKSLTDMLARAKANPGKLTYASAGNGSTTQIAAAIFAQRAGVSLTHVPYKGNPAAWPDLVAGRVDMLMEGYGGSISMIKDGKMKPLGVTSTKRLEGLPDVPTIAEQGVPNYSFYFWIGLVGPAGMPKHVVQKLSSAMQTALNSAELKDRFRNDGSEAMLMSPDEFNEFLKREVATYAKVVSDLNLPKE